MSTKDIFMNIFTNLSRGPITWLRGSIKFRRRWRWLIVDDTNLLRRWRVRGSSLYSVLQPWFFGAPGPRCCLVVQEADWWEEAWRETTFPKEVGVAALVLRPAATRIGSGLSLHTCWSRSSSWMTRPGAASLGHIFPRKWKIASIYDKKEHNRMISTMDSLNLSLSVNTTLLLNLVVLMVSWWVQAVFTAAPLQEDVILQDLKLPESLHVSECQLSSGLLTGILLRKYRENGKWSIKSVFCRSSQAV